VHCEKVFATKIDRETSAKRERERERERDRESSLGIYYIIIIRENTRKTGKLQKRKNEKRTIIFGQSTSILNNIKIIIRRYLQNVRYRIILLYCKIIILSHKE
jgi:hypothetical protein